MKYLMILTVGVCLLFAAVPVVAQNAADEAAIREANEQRIAIWNAKKDAKAYLVFFDEDCTNGFNGNPCAAEIRESGEFSEQDKNARIKILEQGDVVFITPDVAIYRYTSEISGRVDADGKPRPPGKSQNAVVYAKKDGKWLLAAHNLRRPVEE